MRHGRAAFAVLLAIAGLGISDSALAADGGQSETGHSITVFNGGGGASAVFTVATCHVKRSSGGKTFLAEAISTSRRYKLFVKIFAFSKFTEYQVEQGQIDPNPSIQVDRVGGEDPKSEFGNRFVPTFPSFGFGAIVFRRTNAGALLMGVGYGPAMYSRDLSDAVSLTGVVPCKKQRKPEKARQPVQMSRDIG